MDLSVMISHASMDAKIGTAWQRLLKRVFPESKLRYSSDPRDPAFSGYGAFASEILSWIEQSSIPVKLSTVPGIFCSLLLVLFFSDCASQAPPDEAITNGVFDLYGKTLTAMDTASNLPYAQSKRSAFYTHAHHALDVLKLRAEVAATAKDQSMVTGIAKLDHQYTLMQSNDQSGWAKNARFREELIQDNLDGIRQQIENIAFENAGKKAAAAISGRPSDGD